MPKKKTRPAGAEPEKLVNCLTTRIHHTENLTTETGLRLLAQAVDKLTDDNGIDWDDIGAIHMTAPTVLGQRHKGHARDWVINVYLKNAIAGFRHVDKPPAT